MECFSASSRMSFLDETMFTATLAGKGEETSSPPSPLSLSEPSLLLKSSSLLSSTFPSFPTSYDTTIPSAKPPSTMPSKNSNVPFQQFNKIPSTITNVNDEPPITTEQQDKSKDLDNALPSSTSSSSNSRRRVPLPTKLSFEQNITNMIEKESPLLQSELLTAEHELSVLRSRLAVNEGVTAITGTILESLKGQFDAHHKVDSTTSPFDTCRTNILQQSLGSQTSPSNEKLPDCLEIHYDAESPKSHYIVVKAVNSFWVAQPIPDSQVQEHLQKFSSPVMKRAAIKLPDSFEFDSDTEVLDEEKQVRSRGSISDEDESIMLDRYEQLSEMKTIRSSSLLQHEDQFENFENKIEEIYLIIDQLRHKSLSPAVLNTLQKKINDLKFILHKLNFSKQDRLHVDYQLTELESQCTQNPMPKQYDFIDLFENDLNSLQHIIEQLKTNDTSSQRDLISDFEDKLELIQTIDEDTSSNEYKMSPKPQPRRLIPESPVITSDVFFEGDKTLKSKKTPATPPNHRRLIPEDARISASSFYEGDIHRSLYHHVDPNKDAEQSPKKKSFIPEKPLVSSEVFYEGDLQRSMFAKDLTENPPEPSSPPLSIENLREIMSDLMLAASWSRKPTRIEKQPTHDEEEEILAESFITTERRHSKSSLCEIIHEIEKLPSSTFVEDHQLNKSRQPTIIEEDETVMENAREPVQEDLSTRKSPNEIAFIFVSPPSLEQDDDDKHEDESNEANSIPNDPSNENEFVSSEYEARLRQTSNEIVGRILNGAILEAIEYEQEQLYYKTAVELVQHAIENALIKYDNELTPSEFSSTSSEHNDEVNSDGYLSSDDENEENEKLIPQISDQPYLFVTDVVASKSAQELGDLVQELQTLEQQIHHTRPRSSSSSSSCSLSENETSHIAIPQIMTTKSVTELTNLVVELQDMEEKLEDQLDEPLESVKSPISSKSFNELGGLMNELQTVSKQLNNRIHEEIFISTNIDSLSEDIIKYRRDSLATLQQLDENQAVQDMVDNIIKEARDIMIRESNLKTIPTIIVDQRRLSGQQSSTTSISDDLGLSHEDNSVDQTSELAAQLDYLRRMSRYDNPTYDQPSFTSSTADSHEDNEDFKSASYMTMTNEDGTSSDEDSRRLTKSEQQIDVSRDSVTQPSSDSLDYHSTEVEINEPETPRRTTSEHSLRSTSSSLQTHEPHSLSTLCLIDKDELVPSDNDQDTANIGFLDRMKLLVNKPVEIVQEAMGNLGKQRTSDPAASTSDQQRFQSAHDLHDEEKSKLVRSPELYNIGNVVRRDQRSLLASSQMQHRTLSESALASDDSKRHSLTTTSNDASVEFLTALSKENSMEFSQQRLSTPFDDVLEKESSPEQSEYHPPPTSTFSDAIEPTSSCQRPLAFRALGQQNNITEEQYYTVANNLVHQVLNDVVSELNDEQDNSSAENISDRLSISNNSSSSSDDEVEKLAGIDEEEAEEYIPDPSPPPPLKIPPRSPHSKILRRAQTDTKHFDIIQSPVSLVPPIVRRNSQSDTDVYFHTVSASLHDYGEMQNSSSDEECPVRKHHEKYSGEGEDSSGGGGERPTSRRKRSTDQTNVHESLALKFESNDNSKRRESLDSPPKDSTEKSLLKTLQEGILRTNLESLQTELKLASPKKDYLRVNVYSSVTKKPSANYDYDAGSETDRDDTISKTHRKSVDAEAKTLLDDMVESINSDNLSKSISSEPVSSQSDATTVIFKSNKTSLDDEEHYESPSHQSNLNTNQFLSIHPSFASSASASSSPSVIYQQQMQTKLTSIVNTQSKKQFSTPSFSTTEFVGQCTKKKYPSYPGSLEASHIPSSSASSPSSNTSIPNDYHSISATSTTLQSGQQHVDE